MYKFTIGSDPELFIRNKDNKIISAEGLIGGSKDNPILFDDRGFFIQEDNVMAEFNIPPANSKEEFIEYMQYARDWVEAFLSTHDVEPVFANKVTHEFQQEQLQSNQARLFGCEPDWNVYLRQRNRAPSANTAFRSCGGHIHIGFDYNDQADQENLIRALDATLGLSSVFYDKDEVRRKGYGKAGNFRFKPYGVEYRTPSNFWISNDQSVGWVYNKVEEAFSYLPYIKDIYKLEEDIQKAINNRDEELANSTIEKVTSLLIKQKV